MAKQKAQKKRGPYLAAAFFCDQVILGNDGALTPVRICDSLKVDIAADAPSDFPSKDQRLAVRMAGLLSFKTGDALGGEYTVRIVMESPSGKTSPVYEQKIKLTEPAHGGGNLIFQNIINLYKGGLFWFNVYLDGKLMTRIPIQITYERLPPEVPSFPPSGTPSVSTKGSESDRADKRRPKP